MADHFTYRVSWSEEDGEHVGTCAEFPSLSHLDADPEAALRGIRALVDDVVAEMRASGERVPEPIADQTYSGKFLARIPPELHRLLAIEAAEAGVSLNRLVSFRLAIPPALLRAAPDMRDSLMMMAPVGTPVVPRASAAPPRPVPVPHQPSLTPPDQRQRSAKRVVHASTRPRNADP